MNRQPLPQPNYSSHSSTTPVPVNAHWWDEDLDRRVTSPDGKVAVAFICKKWAKKPSVWKPVLIRVSDNENMLFVTVSSGSYYITSGWRSNELHRVRIGSLPRDDNQIIERLFDVYKAAKV